MGYEGSDSALADPISYQPKHPEGLQTGGFQNPCLLNSRIAQQPKDPEGEKGVLLAALFSSWWPFPTSFISTPYSLLPFLRQSLSSGKDDMLFTSRALSKGAKARSFQGGI